MYFPKHPLSKPKQKTSWHHLMSGSQEDYARTRKSTKKDDKKVQEHRVDYV